MKFELGKIVITTNADQVLDRLSIDNALWNRYVKCDWGNLSQEDKQTNANALKNGGRLLGSYTDNNGTKFWIITESDRSCTTILLPEDY